MEALGNTSVRSPLITIGVHDDQVSGWLGRVVSPWDTGAHGETMNPKRFFHLGGTGGTRGGSTMRSLSNETLDLDNS